MQCHISPRKKKAGCVKTQSEAHATICQYNYIYISIFHGKIHSYHVSVSGLISQIFMLYAAMLGTNAGCGHVGWLLSCDSVYQNHHGLR